MRGYITYISTDEAKRFLLPKHYSGRMPMVCIAFGWYDEEDNLKAVVTFGKPASPDICEQLCGIENKEHVYELNRLCRTEDWKEPLSQLVSYALKDLKRLNWIIVSYSDTGMNHHGYIYQACNFLYTGVSKDSAHKTVLGKHSRSTHMLDDAVRVLISGKHRYVYFCAKDKKTKKEWMSKLKYPILPYPKGNNNPDYKLGDFMKDKIIDSEEHLKEVQKIIEEREKNKGEQISLL